MLPLLGALVIAAILIVALAADLLRYAATVREVAFAADVAAEAGAAVVDPAAAYAGTLRLAPAGAVTAATQAALQTRPRPGRSVDVTVIPGMVCVAVSEPFASRFVPGTTVRVDACAQTRRG